MPYRIVLLLVPLAALIAWLVWKSTRPTTFNSLPRPVLYALIGVLSIVTVANRIYFTYLTLEGKPQPNREGLSRILWRAFYWTDDRATVAYDLWVLAIMAFIWITPPSALGDPMASGQGLIQWLMGQ